MSPMPSDKLLEEYEVIPETALAASRWLVDIWEQLGKPDTPLSESGEKMMRVIIVAWEELYPEEARVWRSERKDYKASELAISEQIRKHTGRSLASYPYPIFQMMRTIFPHFKPGDRKSCMKLVAKFPMFRLANRI